MRVCTDGRLECPCSLRFGSISREGTQSARTHPRTLSPRLERPRQGALLEQRARDAFKAKRGSKIAAKPELE